MELPRQAPLCPGCLAFSPPRTEPDTIQLAPPKLNSTIEIRSRPGKQNAAERWCVAIFDGMPDDSARTIRKPDGSPGRPLASRCFSSRPAETRALSADRFRGYWLAVPCKKSIRARADHAERPAKCLEMSRFGAGPAEKVQDCGRDSQNNLYMRSVFARASRVAKHSRKSIHLSMLSMSGRPRPRRIVCHDSKHSWAFVAPNRGLNLSPAFLHDARSDRISPGERARLRSAGSMTRAASGGRSR